MNKAISIFVSDLHLSNKVPICRAKEPDWINKQLEYLAYLKDKQEEYQCPVIIAGDIWDKWYGCSLIDKTFVNTCLNIFNSFKYPVYSIPGNHDLPNHNIDLINKSAYKTITTGVIKDFSNQWLKINDVAIYGFPFDSDYVLQNYIEAKEHIAVIHELIWMKEPFPNADVKGNIVNIASKLSNFNVIVAGDNHLGFDTKLSTEAKEQLILNCGGMIRDTTALIDYKPRCYVYFGNNEYQPLYFPIENDIINDEHIVNVQDKMNRLDIFSKLLDTKNKKKGKIVKFEDAIKSYTNKNIVKETIDIIQEVLDEAERE